MYQSMSPLELWTLNHNGLARRRFRVRKHLAMVDDDGVNRQWLHDEGVKALRIEAKRLRASW